MKKALKRAGGTAAHVVARAAVTILTACSVGPDYQPPAAPEVAGVAAHALPTATVASSTLAGTAQNFSVGHDVPGDWWTLFRSPEIVVLVQQALAANPDLAAAQATLKQARENLRAGQGVFFPSVSVSPSVSREQISLAGFGGVGASKPFTLYSASLSVSYTFDVFGGERRQVEELGATAEYDQHELEAAYLTLTANLVNALLVEASLKAQIDATQEIVRLYQDELRVVQQRFDLGGVSRADVLQQQASLAAEVATLPPLRKQLEQQRNQVAAYLGLLPGQYTKPTIDLASLTLPGDLPVSLPSQLVEQRPDIRAYAALLHSATAAVGVATANMLPQLTLTGSYGTEGTQLSQLFTPGGLVYSVAAMLTQPIFQGGTLLARKRAAVAALDVAAAQYSSTVNVAFQNVANALVAVERDAETLRADLASEQTAQQSLDVARTQFQAGAGTYLNVLQAEQNFQSAHLLMVSAQAARFSDTVALFQSLGGGWWHRSDVNPEVEACCGILP